ncbi:MAG: GNAT family N-acetyltransferase [Robiginitalea sp.]|nr:GNAT family N-acetyltransferase [Robiginitalea sp.]
MEPVRLEPCPLSDLEVLRQIALETFKAAFAAQNDPEDFEAYLREAFSTERLRMEMAEPQSRFFFLYEREHLAGYAKVNTGKAQSEPQDAGALEIERIYVREPFQGKGLGSWLLRRLISLAREEGKTYLWLGVWEENKEAIRFYKRHGFAIFGKHPYYIGSDRQMDWMMRLNLNSGKGR